jgi:hypothetical protein
MFPVSGLIAGNLNVKRLCTWTNQVLGRPLGGLIECCRSHLMMLSILLIKASLCLGGDGNMTATGICWPVGERPLFISTTEGLGPARLSGTGELWLKVS